MTPQQSSGGEGAQLAGMIPLQTSCAAETGSEGAGVGLGDP